MNIYMQVLVFDILDNLFDIQSKLIKVANVYFDSRNQNLSQNWVCRLFGSFNLLLKLTWILNSLYGKMS